MKDKFFQVVPYIIILVLVLLLKTFFFATIRVNGDSMFPTLVDKDIMLLDKISYKFTDIKRFDIVVVKTDSSKIIKRVIGLPKEEVKYENNKLYINGNEIKDFYNSIEMHNFIYELGDNEYFVLGDNREDSLDSRIIGAINKEDILGRARIIIYPFDRIGIK